MSCPRTRRRPLAPAATVIKARNWRLRARWGRPRRAELARRGGLITAPRPRKSRSSRKRRQGRQPGAPGAHLAWSEHPDKTVPLFPQGTCGCGRDLTDAADLGVAGSHQVIDTPVATAPGCLIGHAAGTANPAATGCALKECGNPATGLRGVLPQVQG